MRALAKSMFSYSWGMSLFLAKQMVNVTMPTGDGNPFDKTAGAFDSVTKATVDQLGSTLKAAYNAGDTMQKGMVDIAFSMMSPGSWDPGRLMKLSAETLQKSAKAAQEAGQTAASTA